MAKQVDLIEAKFVNVDLSKCFTYYKSQMSSRAWASLLSSIIATDISLKVNGKQKAKAIIFVSSHLILVI